MTKSKALALCLALTAPAVALAEGEQSCPLTYDTFEVGVPHTDLETCPASMATEGAYCRVSVVAEVATIFAFGAADDCLITSRAYFEDQFVLTLE